MTKWTTTLLEAAFVHLVRSWDIMETDIKNEFRIKWVEYKKSIKINAPTGVQSLPDQRGSYGMDA